MEAPRGIPVKVLAVSEEGKPLRPCKYKIADRSGSVETVPIHKILWVDTRAILFVAYRCETYYESTMRRYELRYWKQDFKWELFARQCSDMNFVYAVSEETFALMILAKS